MYADDLALISTEEYVGTSKFRLQDSLKQLQKWTDSWGMKVNANKTQCTIFTLSTKQKEIKLTFGNSPVEINNNPVYLGVTFDPQTYMG